MPFFSKLFSNTSQTSLFSWYHKLKQTMRKANQEITNPAVIEEIFVQSGICRIAMIDKDLPYLLPFNYGYADQCLYMHSAPAGKKLDVLRENPRVCFEVEQQAELVKNELACKWATCYRSVVGYGQVEIVTDYAQKLLALDVIMQHNGAVGKLQFEPKQVDALVVMKLQIETMTGKQSGNWDRIHEDLLVNFESERLCIQELDWSDLEAMHALHSIPEVDEFNTLGIPESIEVTRQILKSCIGAQSDTNRGSYHWKIGRKENAQLIGMAGMILSNDKFRIGEIYYKFDPAYWGSGYGTEIAKRLIKLGFEHFKLHIIEAGVAVNNSRSIQVLEKAGMHREGLRRKILPIRGEWVDNYHYAIVESDFQ